MGGGGQVEKEVGGKKKNHQLKTKIHVELLAGRGPLSSGEGFQQHCTNSRPGGTLSHGPDSCGCGRGLFWRGEGCFSAGNI